MAKVTFGAKSRQLYHLNTLKRQRQYAIVSIMNLNPNKYSSAIVKTELYKCSLFPNLHAFSDHGENNLVNVSV